MEDKTPKIRKKTMTREPNKGKLEWTSKNYLLDTRDKLTYGEISWRNLGNLSWKELINR